jgi:hypothetical protein
VYTENKFVEDFWENMFYLVFLVSHVYTNPCLVHKMVKHRFCTVARFSASFSSGEHDVAPAVSDHDEVARVDENILDIHAKRPCHEVVVLI